MVAASLALILVAAPLPQRSSPAEALIDSAILAHRSLAATRAELTSNSKLDVASRYTCSVFVVKPNQALIRLKTPQQVSVAPTDRSYFVSGDRLSAYDHLAGEVIRRRAAENATLLTKIEAATGPLDEPIRALLDSGMMEALLLKFRLMSGWKVSKKSGMLAMAQDSVQKGVRSHLVWTFDDKTRLVRGATLKRGKQSVTWSVTYGTAPTSLSLSTPPAALPVDSFLQKPVMPKSINAKTSSVLIRSILAFSKLRQAAWTSREAGNEASVWVSGPSVREKTAVQEWVYDGKMLTVVLAKARLAYRGECRFGAIGTALNRCGARVDATTWQYLSRKSPVLSLLSQHSAARLAGELELNGVPCDIVEFKDATSVGSVTIRRTDNLIAGTGFTRTDASGKVLSNTWRSVQFHSVGKALPATTFQVKIPDGVKVQAIPRPKKG
ncbi:MAG: hypothetical protein HZC36_00080 [Armatimonadetes bacterium]|nr:hypothetical protein [Armatimonadota bacterium]